MTRAWCTRGSARNWRVGDLAIDIGFWTVTAIVGFAVLPDARQWRSLDANVEALSADPWVGFAIFAGIAVIAVLGSGALALPVRAADFSYALRAPTPTPTLLRRMLARHLARRLLIGVAGASAFAVSLAVRADINVGVTAAGWITGTTIGVLASSVLPLAWTSAVLLRTILLSCFIGASYAIGADAPGPARMLLLVSPDDWLPPTETLLTLLATVVAAAAVFWHAGGIELSRLRDGSAARDLREFALRRHDVALAVAAQRRLWEEAASPRGIGSQLWNGVAGAYGSVIVRDLVETCNRSWRTTARVVVAASVGFSSLSNSPLAAGVLLWVASIEVLDVLTQELEKPRLTRVVSRGFWPPLRAHVIPVSTLITYGLPGVVAALLVAGTSAAVVAASSIGAMAGATLTLRLGPPSVLFASRMPPELHPAAFAARLLFGPAISVSSAAVAINAQSAPSAAVVACIAVGIILISERRLVPSRWRA